MPGLYKHLNILLLSSYVASLLFVTTKVFSETSASFILGMLWVVTKLWGVLFRDKTFRLQTEGVLLMALYLYLVGVDLLVHGGSVFSNYYISFALNGIIFLLLVDEFSKNIGLREKMMRVFSATTVLVAMLFLTGTFTTESQSGRLTFMHQNENDLAINFVIAFIFVTISFIRSVPKKPKLLVCAYASAMLLLAALTYTGSRFPLCITIVTMLLLIVTALKTPDKRSIYLFVFVCLTFLVIMIGNFKPTLERVTNDNPGYNLSDLGGRMQLWQYAADALTQSPVVGVGYDGFQRLQLEHEKYFSLPHNFALEVGALGGGIGLILLAALFCYVLRRVYHYSVQFKSLDALIWCMPIFVTAMMLNITHMKVFWFLAAYFAALFSPTQKNVAGGAVEHHVI